MCTYIYQNWLSCALIMENFIECKLYYTNPRLPGDCPRVPGDSSFWRWPYQPQRICSENSFSTSILTQFSLCHPCSPWMFQFSLVFFTGKSQLGPLSFIPQHATNTAMLYESILLKVWWWRREVTSQERKQLKLDVRQHVSAIHHAPPAGSDSHPPHP